MRLLFLLVLSFVEAAKRACPDASWVPGDVNGVLACVLAMPFDYDACLRLCGHDATVLQSLVENHARMIVAEVVKRFNSHDDGRLAHLREVLNWWLHVRRFLPAAAVSAATGLANITTVDSALAYVGAACGVASEDSLRLEAALRECRTHDALGTYARKFRALSLYQQVFANRSPSDPSRKLLAAYYASLHELFLALSLLQDAPCSFDAHSSPPSSCSSSSSAASFYVFPSSSSTSPSSLPISSSSASYRTLLIVGPFQQDFDKAFRSLALHIAFSDTPHSNKLSQLREMHNVATLFYKALTAQEAVFNANGDGMTMLMPGAIDSARITQCRQALELSWDLFKLIEVVPDFLQVNDWSLFSLPTLVDSKFPSLLAIRRSIFQRIDRTASDFDMADAYLSSIHRLLYMRAEHDRHEKWRLMAVVVRCFQLFVERSRLLAISLEYLAEPVLTALRSGRDFSRMLVHNVTKGNLNVYTNFSDLSAFQERVMAMLVAQRSLLLHGGDVDLLADFDCNVYRPMNAFHHPFLFEDAPNEEDEGGACMPSLTRAALKAAILADPFVMLTPQAARPALRDSLPLVQCEESAIGFVAMLLASAAIASGTDSDALFEMLMREDVKDNEHVSHLLSQPVITDEIFAVRTRGGEYSTLYHVLIREAPLIVLWELRHLYSSNAVCLALFWTAIAVVAEDSPSLQLLKVVAEHYEDKGSRWRMMRFMLVLWDAYVHPHDAQRLVACKRFYLAHRAELDLQRPFPSFPSGACNFFKFQQHLTLMHPQRRFRGDALMQKSRTMRALMFGPTLWQFLFVTGRNVRLMADILPIRQLCLLATQAPNLGEVVALLQTSLRPRDDPHVIRAVQRLLLNGLLARMPGEIRGELFAEIAGMDVPDAVNKLANRPALDDFMERSLTVWRHFNSRNASAAGHELTVLDLSLQNWVYACPTSRTLAIRLERNMPDALWGLAAEGAAVNEGAFVVLSPGAHAREWHLRGTHGGTSYAWYLSAPSPSSSSSSSSTSTATLRLRWHSKLKNRESVEAPSPGEIGLIVLATAFPAVRATSVWIDHVLGRHYTDPVRALVDRLAPLGLALVLLPS